MTPHEETLEHDGKGLVWVKGSLAGLRHRMPDGHSCTPAEVIAYGALFSAAPELVRALKAFVEIVSSDPSFHDPSGEPDSYAVLIHAQQALKKAGVL